MSKIKSVRSLGSLSRLKPSAIHVWIDTAKYSTFKTGVDFIEWVYLVKLAGTLDPMVTDGALDPKDSLLYYYVSKDIRGELNRLSEVIYLSEKDIRGKATANDEARLRELYKTLSPYINMLKGAIL